MAVFLGRTIDSTPSIFAKLADLRAEVHYFFDVLFFCTTTRVIVVLRPLLPLQPLSLTDAQLALVWDYNTTRIRRCHSPRDSIQYYHWLCQGRKIHPRSHFFKPHPLQSLFQTVTTSRANKKKTCLMGVRRTVSSQCAFLQLSSKVQVSINFCTFGMINP